MARKQKPPSNSYTVFHGYSVETVALWCQISKKQARDYCSGRRLPTRADVYMFNLHKNEKNTDIQTSSYEDNVIELGPFYGYPPELIEKWCRVNPDKARLIKSGAVIPSPSELYLFELHRDGKILGTEWDGWRIQGNQLFDPANVPLTQRQLEAYQYVYQLASERASKEVTKVLMSLMHN